MTVPADETIPDRRLSQPEVYQMVARAALTMAQDHARGGRVDMASLVHAEACAVALDVRGNLRQSFAEANRESFTPIANRFVNRLVQTGILERDWSQISDKLYHLVPDQASTLESITSLEGFSTLEFVETLDDPELRARCEQVVLMGAPGDLLLREAATVFENRLRQILGNPKETNRRKLAADLLHPNHGRQPVGPDGALKQDFFMLTSGLLGFYGTEVHHKLLSMSPKSARRVVAMFDEILIQLPS